MALDSAPNPSPEVCREISPADRISAETCAALHEARCFADGFSARVEVGDDFSIADSTPSLSGVTFDPPLAMARRGNETQMFVRASTEREEGLFLLRMPYGPGVHEARLERVPPVRGKLDPRMDALRMSVNVRDGAISSFRLPVAFGAFALKAVERNPSGTVMTASDQDGREWRASLPRTEGPYFVTFVRDRERLPPPEPIRDGFRDLSVAEKHFVESALDRMRFSSPAIDDARKRELFALSRVALAFLVKEFGIPEETERGGFVRSWTVDPLDTEGEQYVRWGTTDPIVKISGDMPSLAHELFHLFYQAGIREDVPRSEIEGWAKYVEARFFRPDASNAFLLEELRVESGLSQDDRIRYASLLGSNAWPHGDRSVGHPEIAPLRRKLYALAAEPFFERTPAENRAEYRRWISERLGPAAKP